MHHVLRHRLQIDEDLKSRDRSEKTGGHTAKYLLVIPVPSAGEVVASVAHRPVGVLEVIEEDRLHLLVLGVEHDARCVQVDAAAAGRIPAQTQRDLGQLRA